MSEHKQYFFIQGYCVQILYEMNGVLGQDRALVRLYWAGDNEMNLVMNHTSGKPVGLVARSFDQ